MSNKKYFINWDDPSLVSISGKTTIYTDKYSFDEMNFVINCDGELEITSSDNKTVRFSKFSSLKYIYDDNNIKNNLITEGKIINYDNIISVPKKGKLTGTKYSDKIKGTDNIDKIYAGYGDDIIYSSVGNDSISGGFGTNSIIYKDRFDTDTITLTNHENLILDLTYFEKDNTIIKYSVEKGYLILNVFVSDEHCGTIKLKNFGTKNVVGNGSVSLLLNDTSPIDLNTFNLLSYDKSKFSTKGVFTGSRFSETIDATGVEHNTTIKGGAGYNIITGTDGYTDKITGGNDGNKITVYSGNKSITTGSGADDIVVEGDGTHTISAGNGQNNIKVIGNGKTKITTGKDNDIISVSGNSETTTIYAGKGSNTINIDNTNGKFGSVIIKEQNVSALQQIYFKEDLNSDYELYRNGQNLIIKNSITESSLKIEKYFSTSKKTAEYEFYHEGQIYENFSDLADATKGFIITGKSKINGTDYKDVITGGKGNDKINAGKGDDTINAGKGNDTINAGQDNNKIIFHEGDGNDTIINGGGIDTLVFDKDIELNFQPLKDDLFIFYGESDSVRIKDYKSGTSVSYIKIGDNEYSLSEFFKSVSRSYSTHQMTLYNNVTTNLLLNDTFQDKDFNYSLKSLSETPNNITLSYLENGRLVIYGDYVNLAAQSGQDDDIIFIGSYNNIVTGDGDDIVRLGFVIDSTDYYQQQSNFNTISTDSGSDYVTYYGLYNTIDTGADSDRVQQTFTLNDIPWEKVEKIYNCEDFRITLEYTNEIDYQVGWYCQGSLGGDCRLFSMLESLSSSKNFKDLSDIVTIKKLSEENYSVTFNNYSGSNNTASVAKSDLVQIIDGEKKGYVAGDLDVALIDYALNKLIAENNQSSVMDVDYEILSDYIFGSSVVTYLDPNYESSSEEYKAKLNLLWNAYKNGEINNLTIGTGNTSGSSRIGVVGGHAYSLKEFNSEYVTLINVWDNADKLTLDLDKFYSFLPCAIVYGVDMFQDNSALQSKYKSSSYCSNEISYDEITGEVVSWMNSDNSDLFFSNQTDYHFEENIVPIYEYIETSL